MPNALKLGLQFAVVSHTDERGGHMIRVSEIMIKDPVCCTSLTNSEESKKLIKKYHCKKLPVVNTLHEKRIIGVVSEVDLDGLVNKNDLVIHCMSKNIHGIYEDETVGECLKLMIINNIEQVHVIDKQGHFCGIVTQDDILK